MVKRSMGQLAKIGKEAVEYLLNGATFWKIDGNGYRLYEKKGRFNTARKDFKNVKPINYRRSVRKGSKFKSTGTVGDRLMELRYNANDKGYGAFPSLIIKSPGESPIKIIYK